MGPAINAPMNFGLTRKTRIRMAVAILSCAFIGVTLESCFVLEEMHSSSMEPVIFGNDGRPGRGDYVLIARAYPHRYLKQGDIVLIYLQQQETATLRAIRSIATKSNGELEFRIEALATDGIDSDNVCPIAQGDVHGKVVWIFHRKRDLEPTNTDSAVVFE